MPAVIPIIPDELGPRICNAHRRFALVDFVQETTFDDLSPEAINYLKIFIMGTLAVGIARLILRP